MSLQARLSRDDPRLYSANRDVAHNFHFVTMSVAGFLEKRRWPALAAYAAEHNVTDEQLGRGMQAFIRFVAGAVDKPEETMDDVMTRCGWLEQPEAVQVIIMAALGVILTGVYFHGAREATIEGEGPCSDVRELVRSGEECMDIMRRPRLLRPLYRGLRWLRRLWRAFRTAS